MNTTKAEVVTRKHMQRVSALTRNSLGTATAGKAKCARNWYGRTKHAHDADDARRCNHWCRL